MVHQDFCRLVVLVCVVSVFQSVPVLAKEELHLYNWEAYLAEEVIAAWEKKSGAKLKQTYFDSDEQRDRIVASSNVTFDIVLIGASAPIATAESTLFAEIPESAVPNARFIGKTWRKNCAASRSLPYHWGTLGLLYRTDQVQTTPDSWKDLLYPPAYLQKHIGMIDDNIDTFAPALVYLGYGVNTGNQRELKGAFNILKKQVGHVLTFQYPISFVGNNDKRDQLYLAMGYSGDQFTLNSMTEGNHWRYVVPKEGYLIWTDCLAVMSQSENKSLAYDFLNFINQPEVAAKNAEKMWVAPTNQAAYRHLSNDFKSDEEVFPPEGLKSKANYYDHLTQENMVLRHRMTSALRKLHETQ